MKKIHPHSSFLHDILSAQLHEMNNEREDVFNSQNPEALHKLRVALLRASFALKLLEKYAGDERLAGVRAELKRGRRIMGAVRDMDLVLSHAPGSAAPEVRRAIESRHEHARRELTELLASGWFDKTVTDLDSVIQRTSDIPPRQHRRIFKAALKKILRWDRRKLASDQLHPLRKAFKELRYTAEFLSRYDDVSMPKTMRAIVKFQNILGRRQDAITVCGILSHSKEGVARRLIKHEQKTIRRSEKKFRRRWNASLPVLRDRVSRTIRRINPN